MTKLKAQTSRSPKATNGSMVDQTFDLPHPLQDLTGVSLRVKPIPESVYDHVMERDAEIFERLSKV